MNFQEALQQLREHEENYARASAAVGLTMLRHEALYQKIKNWADEAFKGRSTVEVRCTASEYTGDHWLTISAVLSDGDSWSDVAPLIESLAVDGYSISEWDSVEDAANFARTFQLRRRLPNQGALYLNITLALREGNTGGCRRVYVGKETVGEPTIRDKYVLLCNE